MYLLKLVLQCCLLCVCVCIDCSRCTLSLPYSNVYTIQAVRIALLATLSLFRWFVCARGNKEEEKEKISPLGLTDLHSHLFVHHVCCCC